MTVDHHFCFYSKLSFSSLFTFTRRWLEDDDVVTRTYVFRDARSIFVYKLNLRNLMKRVHSAAIRTFPAVNRVPFCNPSESD